jgi:hypothetical protein
MEDDATCRSSTCGDSRMQSERERENGETVHIDAEGRQKGIRIELAMEVNVDGWRTSSRAAHRQGGREIGHFWVRWGMAEAVPLL